MCELVNQNQPDSLNLSLTDSLAMKVLTVKAGSSDTILWFGASLIKLCFEVRIFVHFLLAWKPACLCSVASHSDSKQQL